MKGSAIRVKGKVQGVGFRPFVWQLAHSLDLSGDVLNDGAGVLIRLQDSERLSLFVEKLTHELPPLARIDTISVSDFIWQQIPQSFTILPSQSTAMDTQVVPDAATCPTCLAELNDRNNRRYHYPFINCTHCGPRFTIIKSLPYDRPNTVMACFPLCADCRAEYLSPADRRYHAQPVACDQCGPMVSFINPLGEVSQRDWLEETVQALQQGQIIAIKSLGGFHLACDATNFAAVELLRSRKQRHYKPFAVMVKDIEAVTSIAECGAEQKKLLSSRIAPIVLLAKKTAEILAENIAPQLAEIGVMLPSNPVQHLLAQAFIKPLVMTSANSTGLPPTLDNDSALKQLHGLADGFVMHNREIIQRCDDSLMRMDGAGQAEVLRRSRGLVPDALKVPDDFPDADGYLAYGGDLKSAFAIGKGRQIIVSQYLGDLSNIETQRQYQQTMEHYLGLYQIDIRQRVADLHPGYFSRQLAEQDSTKSSAELASAESSKAIHYVQHHHAHVAGCLIENGWRLHQGKVLALALDGLGFADAENSDNGENEHPRFLGGELMLADYQQYQIIGGVPEVTVIGGDLAARQPWRSYYAHLKAFLPELSEQKLQELLPGKPLKTLAVAMARKLNTHSIRSAGRLFDAVAASLGIVGDEIEYEGQAACQLEALAWQCVDLTEAEILIPVEDGILDLASFWHQWAEHNGSTQQKAYLFHLALANALAKMVVNAQLETKANHLALTGGVFHNCLLTTLLKRLLTDKIQLLEHQNYSCGDNGLALGQIAVALARGEIKN